MYSLRPHCPILLIQLLVRKRKLRRRKKKRRNRCELEDYLFVFKLPSMAKRVSLSVPTRPAPLPPLRTSLGDLPPFSTLPPIAKPRLSLTGRERISVVCNGMLTQANSNSIQEEYSFDDAKEDGFHKATSIRFGEPMHTSVPRMESWMGNDEWFISASEDSSLASSPPGFRRHRPQKSVPRLDAVAGKGLLRERRLAEVTNSLIAFQKTENRLISNFLFSINWVISTVFINNKCVEDILEEGSEEGIVIISIGAFYAAPGSRLLSKDIQVRF